MNARILGALFLFHAVVPALLSPNVAAASCVTGILPPQNGPWVIYASTIVTQGCAVDFRNDIQVVTGQLLSVQGSVTLTGWINVSQGAQLEVDGGEIHVVGGAPGALVQVFTGAQVNIRNGVLELDGLAAPGVSNQANITFRNSSVTARGYFSATVNSMEVYASTVNVTAPPVGTGQNGGDAILRIGGRISANVVQSLFVGQGAAGGVGTQAGRGGDGGAAIGEFQPRSMSYTTIRLIGGAGGKGGQGANGVSGGDGGAGGDASLTVSSSSVGSSDVCVTGGAGGIGARGSDATATNAGHGGQGRPGGSATAVFRPADTLTLTHTTVCAEGGSGGTGGSGGKYSGGQTTLKGGNGGQGAPGGLAKVEATAPNLVRVEDSEIAAEGGSGGLGGLSGSGYQITSAGRAGAGGAGGGAIAFTNSSAFEIAVNRSHVAADAGEGGNGGAAQQEGGYGGNGGDAYAGAFGLLSVKVVDSCYNATAGGGGVGASGSLAGRGGDGGDGHVIINSTGTVTMIRSCAGAKEGAAGNSVEEARKGDRGFDNLFFNASQLALRDSWFGNSLDDFAGCVRSAFYNVTFTRPGSEIIPLGCAVVDRFWYFGVFVDNGQEPIQDVTIAVTDTTATANYFQPTDPAGRVAFELIGATYTSSTLQTSSHTYSVNASYQGEIKGPTVLTLSRNWNLTLTYPENVRAPVLTMLEPRPKSYSVDLAHPNITMKVKVEDPDDVLTGIPTPFKVWTCITREPICLDVVDISQTRQVDVNTREVTYSWSFNVSRVSDFQSAEYNVCAQASDNVFTSVWLCVAIQINQDVPDVEVPRISAGGNARETATERVSFDGRVSNLEKLEEFGITVLVYRWDFDGDGTWDYNSPAREGGSTLHIYPQVANTTIYTAKFGIVDSLGREFVDERTLTIEPAPVLVPSPIWTYAYVIAYSVLGAVGLSVTAFTVQRRRKRIETEEAQRREAEILANIFECPRCGDLLPEKFAICVRCATEDSIASMRKTVAELKQVGVIVLEEEDMIDKAAISFEGRDFQTSNGFLEKVKARVDVNRKRHKQTTQMIRRERLYIRMLQEQGKDLTAMEPEIYHAELALGRSDFDGAEQMVETIRRKIQGVVYEDKKRDILERLTKLERNVKAFGPTDEASTSRAFDTLKLLERAKVSLGRRSYLEAVTYYTDAFTLMEGSPPEALVTEPTDTELDLFETRLKMQEEGVYLGPSAPKQAEEKVWRPGEKEFKVEDAGVYRPGEKAGVMAEGAAHGRTQDVASQAPPAPFPARAAQGADVMQPVRPMAAPVAARPAAPSAAPAPAAGAAALKCVVCGTTLQPTWNKCPKCATPVPGAPAAARPQPPAPQAPRPQPPLQQPPRVEPPAPQPPTPEPLPPAAIPPAPVVPAPSPIPAAPQPAALPPAAPTPAVVPLPPPPAPTMPAPSAPAPAASAAPAAASAEKCPNCAKPVKPTWKKCPYCTRALHG